MGSTPLAAQASPAGVGDSPNNPLAILRSLEAIKAPNGEYYLAVSGDPERFYAGFFGSREHAEAHRDVLIRRRESMAPTLDINAHIAAVVKANREAGDALAKAVGESVFDLTDILAYECGCNHQAIATIRIWLANAVDDYRKAVDHG